MITTEFETEKLAVVAWPDTKGVELHQGISEGGQVLKHTEVELGRFKLLSVPVTAQSTAASTYGFVTRLVLS